MRVEHQRSKIDPELMQSAEKQILKLLHTLSQSVKKMRGALPRIKKPGDLFDFFYREILLSPSDLSRLDKRDISLQDLSRSKWIDGLPRLECLEQGIMLCNFHASTTDMFPRNIYHVSDLRPASNQVLLPPVLHPEQGIETSRGASILMCRILFKHLGFERHHKMKDYFVWSGRNPDAEAYLNTDRIAKLGPSLDRKLFELFFTNKYPQNRRGIYSLQPQLKRVLDKVTEREPVSDPELISYIDQFLETLSRLTNLRDGWLATLKNKLTGKRHGYIKQYTQKQRFTQIIRISLSTAFNKATPIKGTSHAAVYKLPFDGGLIEEINQHRILPIYISQKNPRQVVPLPYVRIERAEIYIDTQDPKAHQRAQSLGLEPKDIRSLNKNDWLGGVSPEEVTEIDPFKALCRASYGQDPKMIYRRLLRSGQIVPIFEIASNHYDESVERILGTLVKLFGKEIILPQTYNAHDLSLATLIRELAVQLDMKTRDDFKLPGLISY